MKLEYIFFLTFIVALTACKPRNKLNTNEQKLAAQILVEEQEKTEQHNINSEVDSYQESSGIRLKEDRTIDSNNPPIVLDILGNRGNVRPFKYSSLGNRIRYILLQNPNDSVFFKHGANIVLTSNNIIATSNKGIVRFGADGQFIETICENGQSMIIDEKSGAHYSTPELMEQYEGAIGHVSVVGNKVFYKYEDNPNKSAWLMEYDISPGKRNLMLPIEQEQKNMKGKGEKITTLKPRQRSNVIFLDSDHWISQQRKWNSSKTGIFMTVHSLNGDTVCSLKDNDPVLNFSNSTYRGVDDGSNYYLNGKLHIRQSFNDTIYRFEGLNRLVPVYIIDFGDKGIQSSLEGINPKFSLKEKYVPQSVFETNEILVFTYSLDYDCPNTARKGTLKYSKFILDKTTDEMYHAYVDEAPYLPKGKMVWPSAPSTSIVNDIDAGPAFWPTTKTENNKVYFHMSGKKFKEHVNTQEFKKSDLPKEFLEKLAKECKEDETILIIIE